jgi:hypothetical protein
LAGGIPPSREDHLCSALGGGGCWLNHWCTLGAATLPYAMLCSWCRVFVMVLVTF